MAIGGITPIQKLALAALTLYSLLQLKLGGLTNIHIEGFGSILEAFDSPLIGVCPFH